MNKRYYRSLGLSLFLLCVALLLWTSFNLTLGIESQSVAILINTQQDL
ncbi:MAG: hypothetical protein RLO19_25240 [Coleofasciculus sp. G2-EDA-02]